MHLPYCTTSCYVVYGTTIPYSLILEAQKFKFVHRIEFLNVSEKDIRYIGELSREMFQIICMNGIVPCLLVAKYNNGESTVFCAFIFNEKFTLLLWIMGLILCHHCYLNP